MLQILATVYLLPYRGYAGNPGRPSEKGIFSDALAAFDQLSERHRSVAVIGRSLGSSVAIFLAAERPVERLVLIAGRDSVVPRRNSDRLLESLPPGVTKVATISNAGHNNIQDHPGFSSEMSAFLR